MGQSDILEIYWDLTITEPNLYNGAKLSKHLSSPFQNFYASLSLMHPPEDYLCSQLAF